MQSANTAPPNFDWNAALPALHLAPDAMDPLTSQPWAEVVAEIMKPCTAELVAIRIARELNSGIDPYTMPLAGQLRAIDVAANWGSEEFIDTIISLLPLELRNAACQAWDRLN